MKLMLRRDQKPAMMVGAPTFTLAVRAEVSPEEKSAIDKYKLGKTVIYERNTMTDPGSGLLGLASRMAFRAMNLSITVGDLASGKRVECKDIVEMLAVEDQIKEACQTFKAVLNACTQFGGEEVVTI
jgi:hypothetical protein